MAFITTFIVGNILTGLVIGGSVALLKEYWG